MATDLILGTAGHIDHGKTSLVRALTGTDTDRLPEEKRRGITIELGFAQLELGEYRLGIVDVPGHERFVRQMLAGATGMNLAMLVVAADDSVKPQTVEHLDVLRLLDLPAGVIALTKCDLVEPDWLELVEEDIRGVVAGTFFEQSPIIATSATTGEGIDELKSALQRAAATAAERLSDEHSNAPFRMAIDRVFTVAGHGTVVTGSVANGVASVGDELEIQPARRKVRLRGIQNHDQSVQSIGRGQRAAINLAGVNHHEIGRGYELATLGHLLPTQLITTEIDVLASAARPLKNRARVRLHIGTAEILAFVSFMGARRELEQGQRCFAQFFLQEPAAVIWNQPFVIRAESPVTTIGGGRVLVCNATRVRSMDADLESAFGDMLSKDQRVRALAATFLCDLTPWQPGDLVRLAGISAPDELVKQLENDAELIRLEISPQRKPLMNRRVVERWQKRFTTALEKLHTANPLQANVDRNQVLGRYAHFDDDSLLLALLRQMEHAGLVRINKSRVALTSFSPQLSTELSELQESILRRYREAEFQPPTVAELCAEHQAESQQVTKLVQLSADSGQLVHIARDMYLHSDTERELRETLATSLASGGMTLSGIRELLGTTRKYAVPICEYLDKAGFTRRQGDLRILA